MKEIWKDIQGYEDLYQISNLGRVKSLIKHNGTDERILKTTTINGYLLVGLHKKNEKPKGFLVHRLVAQCFIPNQNNLPCINHKDENKTNNCVENLEWCDYSYNINYGTRNKRVSDAQINNPEKSKTICQYSLDGTLVREWSSLNEIERKLSFNKSHISDCCKGGYFSKRRNKFVNTTKYKGFIWRYKNEE